LTGPEGSRRLRLQDFKTIGTWRRQGCQPYAPAVFTTRKYSWYSFLLEALETKRSTSDCTVFTPCKEIIFLSLNKHFYIHYTYSFLIPSTCFGSQPPSFKTIHTCILQTK
jgi:hypothetical protein